MKIQKNFNAILFFTIDYDFDPTVNYTIVLPSDIYLVKRLFYIYSQSDPKTMPFPKIELWFQPHISDDVKIFLIKQQLAPASLIQEYPNPKNPAFSNLASNDKISIFNLGIEMIPLDTDLISLNSLFGFKQLYVDKNLLINSDLRDCLDYLTGAFDGFLSITGIGDNSVAIAETMQTPSERSSNHLIIIDRTADLISPLITPFDYEGILADFVGIDCGVYDIGDGHLRQLNSVHDPLLGKLRLMNWGELAVYIHDQLTLVNSTLDSQKSAKSTKESLDAFKNIAKVTLENKTIHDHISIAERLKTKLTNSKWLKPIMNAEGDALEGNYRTKDLAFEMMEYGCDMQLPLRMFCLEYLLKGSIADYPKILQMFHFNYGLQQFPYSIYLQQASLLSDVNCNIKWKNLVKAFRAFNPDYEAEKDEAAILQQGYAPISVRAIMKLIQGEIPYVQNSFESAGIKFAIRGSKEKKARWEYSCGFYWRINLFRSEYIEKNFTKFWNKILFSHNQYDWYQRFLFWP